MLVISQEQLKDLLLYDKETGKFTWRITRCHLAKAGQEAGAPDFYGYIAITVNGSRCKAHRLAWFYVHGAWPANDIDHINQIKSDNRISNLREATRSENFQNRGKYANNKSGYVGVHWSKVSKKWAASIRNMGKSKHLGLFDSPEAASTAYQTAKALIHRFSPLCQKQS